MGGRPLTRLGAGGFGTDGRRLRPLGAAGVDFAGQIADAAGPGELRDVARELVRSMRRGVVAYSPDDEVGDDLTGDDLP